MKWVSKCGNAIITSYHSYNSTSYYLTIDDICYEKKFFKLNDAKKYAKESSIKN